MCLKIFMKEKRRILNLILAFALICPLLLSLCSCSKESDFAAQEVYYVYYCNASASDIQYKEYSGISATASAYDKVEALLYQMENVPEEYEGCYSVKPDGVEILDKVIDQDYVLTIDFSSGYSDLTNVQEILMRAAIVLTLIQIDGVDAIIFTVEGEPALDAFGDEIGTMSSDTFVGILLTDEGMLTQESDLTIYFTDEEGSVLIPSTVTFSSTSNNLSMEEYILQCLIEGPSESGMYKTLDSTVEVLSVSTTDNICYVNFSASFTEQEQSVSDEIMVYSIVNSLCRLSYISSVQFLVEGDSTVMLHSVTDLSRPLSRNRDLEQS